MTEHPNGFFEVIESKHTRADPKKKRARKAQRVARRKERGNRK